VSWQGLFAPAGTPNDVVKKIHSDMVAALNMPGVRRALLAQGLETVADTPEEFSEYIRRDLAKWAGVVREANVHVD
jgi:tripartite-type tricarboxylate transporter receptor subunit TctC